jgi:DNA polymerase III epsilon subunit-like protein
MNRYLFIDTETLGLGLDKSLLQVGLVVTDDKFNYYTDKDRLYNIKPDDGIYHGTAESLRINNINLVAHDKSAMACRDCKVFLYDFLNSHSYKGKIKLIPVGKNVHGDIAQICDKLISRGSWENFVSYQPLEINGAWRLLEAQGKVPELEKTGLSSIADYFNIPVVGLHNARDDNKLAIEIMRRLIQL